jgi:hypothetical protein
VSIQSDVVTALTGVASDHLFPEACPKDIVLPMVIFVRTSRSPLNTLLGATENVYSEFVFECYSKSKPEAVALADDVRAAIMAAKTTTLPVQFELTVTTEDYTPQTMEFMEPVSYGFWHAT